MTARSFAVMYAVRVGCMYTQVPCKYVKVLCFWWLYLCLFPCMVLKIFMHARFVQLACAWHDPWFRVYWLLGCSQALWQHTWMMVMVVFHSNVLFFYCAKRRIWVASSCLWKARREFSMWLCSQLKRNACIFSCHIHVCVFFFMTQWVERKLIP